MQLGVVGLGRMGGNIARRLMRDGHQSVVFDRDAKSVADVVKELGPLPPVTCRKFAPAALLQLPFGP